MRQGEYQGKTSGRSLKYDAGALIALGSNLTSTCGSPAEVLGKSLDLLEERGGVIRSVSRFYTTPAFPSGSDPDFVNAVAFLEAEWSAADFLDHLHAVESSLGRVRTVRWGQRVIDLDLLAMDDLVLPDRQTYQKWRELPLSAQMDTAPDQLILPHPRLHERAFVLVPLCDIAPDWVHPVLGQTAQQLCDALPQGARSEVRPLD